MGLFRLLVFLSNELTKPSVAAAETSFSGMLEADGNRVGIANESDQVT